MRIQVKVIRNKSPECRECGHNPLNRPFLQRLIHLKNIMFNNGEPNRCVMCIANKFDDRHSSMEIQLADAKK